MKFKSTAFLASSVIFLVLLAPPAAMAASPTAARFEAAQTTHELVATLQAKVIPADVKNTLLKNARAEDRDFAKSIVVHWKAYSERDVRAEFDQLVIKDTYGVEVLKIRPDVSSVSEEGGTLGTRFVINGHIWTKPKTGSIEKSLRQFFKDIAVANHANTSKIFARIFSPAAAYADDTAATTKPAYLYVSLGGFLGEPQNLPPMGTILKNNPKDAIYETRKGWDSVLKRDVPVQCTGSTARVAAKIGSSDAEIESRPDGSVLITFNTGKQKTKLVVTSKKFDANAIKKAIERIQSYNDTSEKAAAEKVLADFDNVGCAALSPGKYILARQKVEKAASEKTGEQDEKYVRERAKAIASYLKNSYSESQVSNLLCDDVIVQACLKDDCSVVSAPSKPGNVFAWIPHKTPSSIDRAKEWRPDDTKVANVPITVDPQTDLLVLNGEGISGDDLRKARGYLTRANEDENDERAKVKNVILSLRPLGQCCGEAECREKLSAKDLNLVPKAGSRPTTK